MGVVPSRCFPNQPNLHLTLFGELRTLHLTLFVELRCPTSHQFRRWCAGVHRIGQRRTLFTITFGRQLLFTVILCRQLLRSNRLLMSFLFTIILRSATLGRRSYWKQPNLARSLTFFNEKGRRLYLCDMMLHHLCNAQLCAGCSFGSSCRKSCTVVCKEQGPWPGPGARAQPQLRFQSALISSRSNLGAHDSRGLGPGVQGPGPGFRAWAWGPGAGGAPGPGARGPRPGARAQGPWPGPGPGVQGPGPVQRVGTCRVTGPTELRHHKHPNQL